MSGRDADTVYEMALVGLDRLEPSERVDVLASLMSFYCAVCGELVPCKACLKQWGVFCLATKSWWPRAFHSQAEAQEHYELCKGPGTRAEVRKRPELDVP